MSTGVLTEAAYPTLPGSPLDADKQLYANIQSAPRTLRQRILVPIRTGMAWEVPTGAIVRISTPEGAQVGDLNIWNRHNPRERMWAARTRQLQAAHVTTYDRLWSTLPYLRPLVTIIKDTLEDYGVDREGGRIHDLLGTRCDPYVNRMLTGVDFDHHCHSNLVRAVLPFGLTEFDVHDVLNVFQCTGLNNSDKYFMKTCPARGGDCIEMFAEQPLLMALSTCPGGDLSIRLWGTDTKDSANKGGDPTLAVCRPLLVEVFELEDSGVLSAWSGTVPPACEVYKGGHGLRVGKMPWE